MINKIGVLDIHTCLQGEGKYSGVPHILVRMSRCNLTCAFSDGVCDSSYASWGHECGEYLFEDIERIIKLNPQINHAMITGGNPSNNVFGLMLIVNLFKDHNYFVAIEDNGTQFPQQDMEVLEQIDFVTLSPKLKNSTPILNKKYTIGDETITATEKMVSNHEFNRTRYESMKKWIDKFDYQLKFVVTDESQLEEIEKLIINIGADKSKVYLMPEGSTRLQLEKRRVIVMELCIKTGYNYTDRLHILAYDTKREA